MAGDGGGGVEKRTEAKDKRGGERERQRREFSERRRAKSDGLLMRSASSQVTALGWAAGAAQQKQSVGDKQPVNSVF